ncbi:hypothetical protein EV426DRAFT_579058 [Tirmania nivea]|nr:hypothetical protein EV426DRAFT_579058 [Tirmania nivea]
MVVQFLAKTDTAKIGNLLPAHLLTQCTKQTNIQLRSGKNKGQIIVAMSHSVPPRRVDTPHLLGLHDPASNGPGMAPLTWIPTQKAVSGYQPSRSLPTIPEADIEAAVPLFTDPKFTPDTASLSAFLEYAIEKNWVVPMHRYKELLDHNTRMHEDVQTMQARLDLDRKTVFLRSRSVRDREDRVEEAMRALAASEEEMKKRLGDLSDREYDVAIYLAEKQQMMIKRERKWWKVQYWRKKMK